MSQEILEERVGHLEGRVGRIETAVALVSTKQDAMQTNVTSISKGVEELVRRDARRPEPIGLKMIGASGTAIAATAVVVWWLIGHSPAVQDLEKRVTKLDDPDIGRVVRIEREMNWTARITRE